LSAARTPGNAPAPLQAARTGASAAVDVDRLSRFLAALARPRIGLPLFVLFGGLVSIALGADANWDLQNYHYYNPWALLHWRSVPDSAPAGIQTFHNPLPDLPFYALVASGMPSIAVAFLMGLPFGVGAYFYFRIARRVVADLRVTHRIAALAAIGVGAFTGTASLSLVGSTMNEWLTSALVLAALHLMVREGRRAPGPSRTMFAVIGLLLGYAVGLKFTAATYAVAAAAVTVTCYRDRAHHGRALVTLALFGLFGFVAAYGYWGAWLAGRYHSPFFPYFNGIFKSENRYPANLIAVHFRPHTFEQWLTWPFKLAERNTLMTEASMREPRLAVLCLVAIALLLAVTGDALRGRRRFGAIVRERMPRSLRILTVFTATSYAFWLVASSVYRYTIPAELMASLLVVVGLRALLRGARYRDVLLGVACVAIVGQTSLPQWGRMRAGFGPTFDVHVPLVGRDALVVTATEPVGYLVPFLPAGARMMRLLGAYEDHPFPHRIQREMSAAVAAHAGPLFVLRWGDGIDPNEERMLAGYRLRRLDAQCEPVHTNLERRRLLVCPLERLGAGAG